MVDANRGQQHSARRPREIIVKFKRTADANRRGALVSARGARILKHFSDSSSHISSSENSPSRRSSPSSAANKSGVRGANYINYATGSAPASAALRRAANDPYWVNNSLWGLTKIQMTQALAAVGAGDGSVDHRGHRYGRAVHASDLAATLAKPRGLPATVSTMNQNGTS